MTVIAWDGKTLAADKRSTSEGLPRTVTKVRHFVLSKHYEVLCGASGDESACCETMEWVRRGMDHGAFPQCQRNRESACDLIVIERRWDEASERFLVRQLKFAKSPVPAEVEDRFLAIGSGRDYAMAAMHLGKPAVEAVELACLYDVFCGNGLDTVSFMETAQPARACPEPYAPAVAV